MGDGGPYDTRSGLLTPARGWAKVPAATAKPDVIPAVAVTDSRRNFLLDFFMGCVVQEWYSDYMIA
jgi:hypothetical protein